MARDDQEPDDLDDVLVGDDIPIPLGPEQPADHVRVRVAGNVRALAHEPAAISVELVVATGARRRIVAAPLLGLVELLGNGLQVRPLVVGQAEPRTERPRRERIGERLGEVAATGVDERLEHLTGERAHPRLEGGDPLLGEVRLQDAAEHRVLRPVDLERRAGRPELGPPELINRSGRRASSTASSYRHTTQNPPWRVLHATGQRSRSSAHEAGGSATASGANGSHSAILSTRR